MIGIAKNLWKMGGDEAVEAASDADARRNRGAKKVRSFHRKPLALFIMHF